MSRPECSTTFPRTRRVRPAAALVVGTLAAVCLALTSPAAAPQEEFDRAARLYEQGEAKAAVEAYDRVLSAGMVTPATLFNQGHAWLKAGHLGQSIACYRRARDLAPRDHDLRASLNFARSRVAEEARFQGGVPRRALDMLNAREWSQLLVATLWLWATVLILRTLLPKWRARTRAVAWTLGGVTALTTFAAVTAFQLRRDAAVIIAPESTTRFGPLAEAQPAFQLPDGAEVRVVDRKDRWMQVRDAGGRTGWVPDRDAVILFP